MNQPETVLACGHVLPEKMGYRVTGYGIVAVGEAGPHICYQCRAKPDLAQMIEEWGSRDLSESYGPGKFYTLQDEYLWGITRAIRCETCGDIDLIGRASKLEGPFDHPDLSDCVGAIVSENKHAIVCSKTYTDKAEFEAAWKEVQENTKMDMYEALDYDNE